MWLVFIFLTRYFLGRDLLKCAALSPLPHFTSKLIRPLFHTASCYGSILAVICPVPRRHFFKIISKFWLLPNFEWISNKCFLSTTCEVISVAGSLDTPHWGRGWTLLYDMTMTILLFYHNSMSLSISKEMYIFTCKSSISNNLPKKYSLLRLSLYISTLCEHIEKELPYRVMLISRFTWATPSIFCLKIILEYSGITAETGNWIHAVAKRPLHFQRCSPLYQTERFRFTRNVSSQLQSWWCI